MDDALAIEATIKVNGTQLEDRLAAHVEQLLVDEDLHRPAMFCMTLLDPDRNIVKECGLRAGAEVEIAATGEGASGDGKLLIGKVVTVECEYDDSRTDVVVRGYAATHQLHGGRHTRVFNDVTDSDIVTAVAGEAGLELGEIEATSEVHEQVTQANQTDWEFLMSRARPIGFDLTISDGALDFTRRGTSEDAPPESDVDSDPSGINPRQLVYGFNLDRFHGRISGAEQVADVEVHGWDPAQKKAFVGRAPAGTGAAGLSVTDPTRLAGVHKNPMYVEVTASVTTAEQAGGVATAIAERIGSAFAEVEGEAHGNTELRAGAAVRISKVNDDFNGAYVLSHVRHVIDRQGYRTHFTVSGHHDRSLLGMITAGTNGNGTSGSQKSVGGRQNNWFGLVRGLVSSIDDQEKLGRVKVELPWLAEEFSSAWAPVVQLGAGPKSGTFFLPAVGDEVLVGFEHGNIDRPIVVGGLFNAMDAPPEYGHFLDNGKVTGRSITSRNGHEIAMYDADDNSGMSFMVVNGSGSPVVTIGLNADDNKLVIQSEGNVEVNAEREITLTGQKITVQAQGDLVLKGGMVKIN